MTPPYMWLEKRSMGTLRGVVLIHGEVRVAWFTPVLPNPLVNMYLPPLMPWFGPVLPACMGPWPTVQKNSAAAVPAERLQQGEIVPSRLGQVPTLHTED